VVERLKAAIEKAQKQREAALADGAGPVPGPAPFGGPAPAHGPAAPHGPAVAPRPAPPADAWSALPAFEPRAEVLRRHRIVTFDKSDPSYVAFDVMRTRLGKVFRDNGWTKLGVVSPTKGCGKSTIAANLAFSLTRAPERRAALIDLDLRQPHLHQTLGFTDRPRIGAFLRGEQALSETFVRVGSNLAIAFNATGERESAELLQSPTCAAAIAEIERTLAPDMLIVDLPPMLSCDDAVGLLPSLDAVMVVAAAGQTRAREIEECERLIGENARFLGVVLNKHDPDPRELYLYDYDSA
jgi:Mrp family chromosome partitioning ATPase